MSGPIRNLLRRVRENRPQRQQRRQERRQNRREMIRSIINPLDSIGAADAYASKPRAGGGFFRSVGAGTSNPQFRGSDANKPPEFTRKGQENPDGPDTGKDAGKRDYSGDGNGDGTGVKSQYAPKNPTAGPKQFTPSPSTPKVMKASTPVTPPAQGERVPEYDTSNTLPAPNRKEGGFKPEDALMRVMQNPNAKPADLFKAAAALETITNNRAAREQDEKVFGFLKEKYAKEQEPGFIGRHTKAYIDNDIDLDTAINRNASPDMTGATPDTALAVMREGMAGLVAKKAAAVLAPGFNNPDAAASLRNDIAKAVSIRPEEADTPEAFFRKAWQITTSQLPNPNDRNQRSKAALMVMETFNAQGFDQKDLSDELYDWYHVVRSQQESSRNPPPQKGFFGS